MKLLAGTDKGIVLFALKHEEWKLENIFFKGLAVGAFHCDHQNRWWVAINHKHWGSKIYVSTDQGEEFKETPSPRFKAESSHRLRGIWTINSNGHDIYLGTEPAAIFKFNGEHFEELEQLSNHPSRTAWQGGGKGSKNPFLHSILFHPLDPQEIMVGISCAGVFQSKDAGQSWKAMNEGLKAFFLPNENVKMGHDPHSIKRHAKKPNVLWQQNHCGVFRSIDNGEHWDELTGAYGTGAYGFDLVIDDKDIDKAWIIPAASDDQRMPTEGKLIVYQTCNAGKSWEALTQGLPQEGAFDVVLRAGFKKKGKHMAFGTNNGNLYYSANEGKSWRSISNHLSGIRCLHWID